MERPLCIVAATNIRSAVDTQILALGIRLSGTHPSFLPGWMNDQLPPSNLAFAWKGAQIAFGASWNPVAEDTGTAIVPLPLAPNSTQTLAIQPKSPLSDLSPADTKNSDNAASQSASVSVSSASQSQHSLAVLTATSSVSSVSFSTPTPTSLKKSSLRVSKPSSTTPLSSTRLKISPSVSPRLRQSSASDFFTRSRSAPSPSSKRLKKAPVTKTYMRLQVPMRVSDISEYVSQTQASIKALHDSWKSLISVDSSHTTVEPWTTEIKIPLLGSSSTFLTSKARLEGKYLPELKLSWSSWTKPTALRFIIGHTKPISEYLDNQSLIRKLDLLEVVLTKEKIQSSKRAVAGYLAGPVITGDSADDLANILQVKSCWNVR
jgi:hypothetical protein